MFDCNTKTGNASTKMFMTYELITPEIAEGLLETNDGNRSLSRGTVIAYVNDMLSGNWDETVGSAISIDSNGVLRDGQHRLTAIVESGVSVRMWVCRNVSSDGIYDNNRKRSNADQIMITRPDFDNVYKTTRFISVARTIIGHNDNAHYNRRVVTPKEIIDFTEAHKEDLDGFFLNMPQSTAPKVTVAVVYLALFMAYMSGVDINNILDFYEVLVSGMSTRPEEFPIIAYRNYLKDVASTHTTIAEIARCQYALKNYLKGTRIKRSISPKELIYPFPYCSNESEGVNT